MKKTQYCNGEEVTPQWVYWNPNPLNKRTGDCVIRAISKAAGKPWADLLREMTEWLIPRGEIFDETTGFGPYIQEVLGFLHVKTEPWPLKWALEAPSMAGMHLIVRFRNHVTYARDGKFYDIWDCSERKILEYWFKKIEPSTPTRP